MQQKEKSKTILISIFHYLISKRLVLYMLPVIFYVMKAGFFQFNPTFGKKSENIDKVRHALSSASADLLVLPEFFATGYQFASKEEVTGLAEPVPAGETTEFLIALSQEKGMYIVAGLPERDGDKFYNSAVLTGPEGFIGRYRKTHLFFEENLFFAPGDFFIPLAMVGLSIFG